MPTPPTDNRAELILQQLDQLPTLPTVAVRVLELTGQDRAAAKDVVRLIESDPSLTARILRIVHRADGGLRGDINSVERAVVFLGFEAVRNAVLAVGVFETFGPHAQPPSGGPRFDRGEFWKHCVAVACMAELLAEGVSSSKLVVGSKADASLPTTNSQLPTPADAFVAGLLHDLGKVALDAALPKSFARVVEAAAVLRGDIADVERTVVGIDHLVVGKRLAERWMLPTMFRDAMWLHGQSPAALPASCRNPAIVNLVTLADVVVRRQHIGYSGNHAYPVPVDALLSALGLTADQLERASAELVGRLEPRCRALGLGEATSDELYRQAITQANRELGRMTDQLATKNRKLAVRAKFFEALSHFHDELRPDAPPATVLFAIAQTATQALDTPAVAAFSYQSSDDAAEYLVANVQHEVVDRGIVDATREPTPEPAATGASPVRVADASLEWLTQRIGPRLGGANVFTIELRIEGRTIGGIAWGATADEPTRLASQSGELTALAGGWALALRTCQIRDESRQLNEQLAEANRRLTSAHEQIMRTRTLASVGEMAAGAAHEMNNPLAIISGRSQLLTSQLSDAKQQGHARLIVEQSQRLSDMITELMEFARPTPAQVAACDVEELIRGGITQAQAMAELADTNSVTIAVDDDVPMCLADAGQVGAAVAEVIVNAYQASEPGGRIEVSAAHDRYGGAIVLSVADRGHGMDERTLARAFDPFFSAMPAGRRRGMGLAKALRWVEASGGTLRLESKPGEGTRVAIVLRAAGGGEATAPQPQQGESSEREPLLPRPAQRIA